MAYSHFLALVLCSLNRLWFKVLNTVRRPCCLFTSVYPVSFVNHLLPRADSYFVLTWRYDNPVKAKTSDPNCVRERLLTKVPCALTLLRLAINTTIHWRYLLSTLDFVLWRWFIWLQNRVKWELRISGNFSRVFTCRCYSVYLHHKHDWNVMLMLAG